MNHLDNEGSRERVLKLLADGSAHSGEDMARQLGITRAAVWKAIENLRELGVEVAAISGQGYRLPHAVALYDAQRIHAQLSAESQALLERVDVLFNVDSTNRHVSDHPAASSGSAVLCVSELQHAGRGRRGRQWNAPFGSGLCMSLGYCFEIMPPGISSLSLMVGVIIARVLHAHGAHDAALKWPNDVLWRGRKLAGVLIEMRGEADGPAQVVIGIGLNLQMPAAVRQQLLEVQAVLITDLHEVLSGKVPDRNLLLASITDALLAGLREFATQGFAAFAQEWRQYDALRDAPVKLMTVDSVVTGIARGVSDEGALLLEVNGEVRRVISGEVSLRAVKT